MATWIINCLHFSEYEYEYKWSLSSLIQSTLLWPVINIKSPPYGFQIECVDMLSTYSLSLRNWTSNSIHPTRTHNLFFSVQFPKMITVLNKSHLHSLRSMCITKFPSCLFDSDYKLWNVECVWLCVLCFFYVNRIQCYTVGTIYKYIVTSAVDLLRLLSIQQYPTKFSTMKVELQNYKFVV